jgi:hypothetical protein
MTLLSQPWSGITDQISYFQRLTETPRSEIVGDCSRRNRSEIDRIEQGEDL